MKSNLRPKPWKPGESGNPGGRPPGSRNLRSILNDILDIEVQSKGLHPLTREPMSREKIPVRELLIIKLVASGLNGNIKAIQDIFDRIDGLPEQNINFNKQETAEGVLAEIDDLKTKISGRVGFHNGGNSAKANKPGKRKKSS